MSLKTRTCGECNQLVIAESDTTLGQIMMYHLIEEHPKKYQENLKPQLEKIMEMTEEIQEVEGV